MPYSHHSHSGQFCGHAQNTLEEMVQTAIAKGFHMFSLTEHIPRPREDFYPGEVRTESWLLLPRADGHVGGLALGRIACGTF